MASPGAPFVSLITAIETEIRDVTCLLTVSFDVFSAPRAQPADLATNTTRAMSRWLLCCSGGWKGRMQYDGVSFGGNYFPLGTKR